MSRLGCHQSRARWQAGFGWLTGPSAYGGRALPADYEAATLQLLDSLDAGMRSSLHEDLAHGRPCELESLHGEIVRRAGLVGLLVPVTATVHAVLAPRAAAANAGPARS